MALRVWLPLNGTLDNIGVSDITVTNNSSTFSNGGKIGNKSSNGRFDFITTPASNQILNYGNFSISFWAKINAIPTSTSETTTYILKCGQNGTRTCLHIAIRNTGAMAFCFYSDDYTFLSDVTQYIGVWTHFAFTYSNLTQYAYINGELVGTRKTGGDLTVGDNSSFIVYNNPTQLNDLRIYDHGLSPKEVKEISQGLILHYKLDGWSGGVGENILTGTGNNNYSNSLNINTATNATKLWCGGSGGNGTFSITEDTSCPVGNLSWNVNNNTSGNRDFQQGNQPYINGQQYTTSFWAKGNGTCLYRSWNTTDGKQMFSKTWTLTSNWTYYTYTFTASEEMETDLCTFHLGVTGNSNISICGMKMEKGSIATPWTPAPEDLGIDTTKITDSSGYGNDGTIQGSLSTINDNARYEISTIFTGSYVDYIYRPALDYIKKPFTISCWAYPKAYPSYRAIMVSNGGKDSISHGIDLYINSSGIPCFMIANNNTAYYASSPNALSLNTWYLLTCTYDGTSMELYVNGELKKTTSATIEPDYDTTPIAFVVGKMGHSYTNTGGYFAFNGYINDVRVYATALSSEDILDLYHTPVSIDNSKKLHTFELEETSENILSSSAFEQGGITDANGTESGMTTRLRTFYIPVTPNTSYKIFTNANFQVRGVHFFTENQTWISYTSFFAQTGQFTTPSNCYYIRIPFQKADNAANITLADLSLMNPTLTTIIARTNGLSNKAYNVNIFKNGITKANYFSISQKSSIDKSGIIEATDFIEK